MDKKFYEDGYFIIENLFTLDEVDEIKQAGIQLTQSIPPKEERVVFNTTQSPQSKNKYFLDSSDKISHFFETGAVGLDGELLVSPENALNKVGHALHDLHPVFHKYTFDERIKEICWRLRMEDPVVVQSMYIYKNPGIGSEVTEHQDATFLHTTPENKILGIWVAMDDATIENGCLWVLPGSHKSGVHRRFIRNPDVNSDELLIFTSPPSTYPNSQFIPVPVKKGSCVLIHGLVVHRSEANQSQTSRHAYTFHCIDEKNCKFSNDNWIKLPEGKRFPRLFVKNA